MAQPQLNAPFTSKEIAPRMIQPETSSIAAAPMVSGAVRGGERPSPRKMRPRSGTAGIDMAAAKKSGGAAGGAAGGAGAAPRRAGGRRGGRRARRPQPGREEDQAEVIREAGRDALGAAAERGFRAGRGAWELRDDRRAEHYGKSIMPRR